MLLESEPIVLITDHRQNLDINADNWIQFFNETLYKRKILNDILIICGKENIYYQAYSVSALGTGFSLFYVCRSILSTVDSKKSETLKKNYRTNGTCF